MSHVAFDKITTFSYRHTGLPSGAGIYCNILHFSKGAEIGERGDRHPCLYYNVPMQRFEMASVVNNEDVYTSKQSIVLHQTYHFVFQQRYLSNGIYQYEVIIDGQIYNSLVNNQAKQFYDMKAYVSNPWIQSCVGIISDVKFTNFQ